MVRGEAVTGSWALSRRRGEERMPLGGVALVGVAFEGVRLVGVAFEGVRLVGVAFEGVRLVGVALHLEGVTCSCFCGGDLASSDAVPTTGTLSIINFNFFSGYTHTQSHMAVT